MIHWKKSLLGAIAGASVIASAPVYAVSISTPHTVTSNDTSIAGFHKRERKHNRHYARDQRVNDNTQIWRGNDGQYRCRRDNGTTGLLIGGAVGGLAGNEIAGRGDKLLGTVIGAGAGALLGREIDRSKARCR